MNDCIFCSVISHNEPHHEILWQDEAHLAFLDRNPVREGHTLVIPKAHAEYLFDMDTDAYAALLSIGQEVAKRLKQATGKKRIALAVEGFSVPHVHLHLVPVDDRGEFAEFRSHLAGDEELRQLKERLSTHFVI